MVEHRCGGCGFMDDASHGYPEVEVPPEAKLSGLPREWVCFRCGAAPDLFIEVE